MTDKLLAMSEDALLVASSVDDDCPNPWRCDIHLEAFESIKQKFNF